MLSLIEVKCPHCGAQGQIMLPPLGAIIIGPCPECEGMVVVFCGRVLPLDKEIMLNGGLEEKRDHLMEVLNEFLKDRIERLFEQAASAPETALDEAEEGLASPDSADPHATAPDGRRAPFGKNIIVPITDDEVQNFVDIDLKLLDNKDYFKAVFE